MPTPIWADLDLHGHGHADLARRSDLASLLSPILLRFFASSVLPLKWSDASLPQSDTRPALIPAPPRKPETRRVAMETCGLRVEFFQTRTPRVGYRIPSIPDPNRPVLTPTSVLRQEATLAIFMQSWTPVSVNTKSVFRSFLFS
jgi:hypothetical protein